MGSGPPAWRAGAVVRHDRHGPGRVVSDLGDTVVVRFDGSRLEQVAAVDLKPASSLHEDLRDGRLGVEADALARARALAITSVNDQWGVFSRSLIELLPHQLWVCKKVTESWPFRWLVADDVGLGKTIECGLVLMPLIASGRVRRLLILTPARLASQWQVRLKQMFDIRVQQYVSEADPADGLFWDTASMVVGSFHTLRGTRRGARDRLLEADPWDVVVVDEAHHLGADEKTGRTQAYQLLEQLEGRRKIGSLLFFTGTPHRGKDFQFYSLMRLVRPDLFDPETDPSENLPKLRKAMIRNNKAGVTDLRGERIFTRVSVAKRDYAYTPSEEHFYRTLSEFVLEGRTHAASFTGRARSARNLVLTTIQKLAASSIAAVRHALEKRRNALATEAEGLPGRRPPASVDEGQEPSDEWSAEEEELAATETGIDLARDEVRWLTQLIELSLRTERETKIERLLSLIANEFPDEPILLFTEYKATQALVVNALHRRFGHGTSTFINGDERLEGVIGESGLREPWSQARADAAEAFNAGRVRFLVSTEAGGEGIDLQERCAVLIHIDMPWNPMRLHQRVGRLSRYGQRREVRVRILRNPATVESRIWELLENKLASIQEALSHTMEDPEDIAELVIGMTENSVYNEMFSRVPDWEGESLKAWFDEKSARLGGSDALDAARSLAGNIARFDFREVGKDLPQVDLPDLKEFVVGTARRHHRRVRMIEEGLALDRTPKAWTERNYAVRDRYEALTFDRRGQGRAAMSRVVGVGHPLMDTALEEARDLEVRVAEVRGLAEPLLLLAVEDELTGAGARARRLVVGVREQGREVVVVPDWKVVKILKGVGRSAEPSERVWPEPLRRRYAELVDNWWRQVDAVRVGRAAGMQRPVAWPEMLLTPPISEGR